jgi:hypothetical protein
LIFSNKKIMKLVWIYPSLRLAGNEERHDTLGNNKIKHSIFLGKYGISLVRLKHGYNHPLAGYATSLGD